MEKTEARTILRLGVEPSASEIQEAYRKCIDEIQKRFAAARNQDMRAQYQRDFAAAGEARDCLLAELEVRDSGRADDSGQLPLADEPIKGQPIATEPPRKQTPAQDRADEMPTVAPGEIQAAEAVEPTTPIERRLRPGELFASQFQLQRELETGVTGPVWLAHDYSVRRTAELVALKFLPDSITWDNAAGVELKHEILRRIALKHPNILRIFNLLEYKGTIAIQMEYVAGQSLSQLRLTHPSQVFEVWILKTWIQELCLALDYAHNEVGITHGEVKPDNLIISPTGSLKLKNFGIENCIRNAMRRSEANSDPSTRVPYQSPQRTAGEKIAISDDIYCVGATIYESLTSTPPFRTSNLLAQQSGEVLTSMAKRRSELGIRGKPIPANWEETVAACLARDPAQRPVSAKEITRRLGNISSPPSILPATELSRQPRRRVWPLIAGIILLLAIVSVIAFHYLYPAGSNPSEPSSPGSPSPSPSGSTSLLSQTQSATPNPKETAEPVLKATASPSPQAIVTPELSASPTQQETVTSNETPSPHASETPLSPSEVGATKEEVVRRIEALPGISAEEKADLIGKMNKAQSMERLVVVPFEIGKAIPSRAVADELVRTLSKPEIRNKLSDPTIILVVAGYADTGGPPDLNLRLSQERAANVSKILKQRVKLFNAIQTVGMGGTELLSNRRPDQNRAVEVWAVAPL